MKLNTVALKEGYTWIRQESGSSNKILWDF